MLPPTGNNMSFNTTPSSSDSSSSSSNDSPLLRRRVIPPDAGNNLMIAALGTNENNAVAQELPADINSLDEIDHFCRFLGHRLRALDRQSRFQLEIKILQIIYDAEFGGL